MSDDRIPTARRTVLKAAAAGATLAGAATGVGAAQNQTDDEGEGADYGTVTDPIGLVTVEGDDSVEATVERIEGTIDEMEDVTHVATVDHAENAAGIDEELRPTTLVLFGNPELGTPLMQSGQSVGIDLPQKMLVWEDEDGAVNVSYNDPWYVAARHGIVEETEIVETMSGALETIATGDGEEGDGDSA